MKLVVRTNLYSTRLGRHKSKRWWWRAAGSILALLAAGAASWLAADREAFLLGQEYNRQVANKTRIEKELCVIRDRVAARTDAARRRDQVLRFANQRWNWAPILSRVLAATPDNVAFTSFRINATTLEEGTLLIAGKSAGAQPRLECDKCRLLLVDALREAGYTALGEFTRLDDSEEVIRSAGGEHLSADFVLQLKISRSNRERVRT